MPLSRRSVLSTAALALAAAAAPPADARQQGGSEPLSLAGPWRFLSSGPATPAPNAPLPALAFSDTIALPGTTETRRKGAGQGPGWTGQLTRVYKFDGPAWYQREITIPDTWRGKRITLFFERTKYTQVWWDDKPLGENPLLTVPQEYVVGTVTPGVHRLTVLVDNTRKPVESDAHQWSDNTQGNWNGILGKIELRATDPVWLDDVQVYPSAARRTATVRVRIKSDGPTGTGSVTVAVNGKRLAPKPAAWSAGEGGALAVDVPLEADAALWDEFHPNLHTLTVRLDGDGIRDERTVRFGLRDFASDGPQFTINGRRTFLRGKHDACVFPLTGHPPMDVAGWRRYFATLRDWGINHVRCHTWCPPDAAFTAADEMGFYLQPELSFWGDFSDKVKAALTPEAVAILRTYGNHPSFVMFTMGNENRLSRDNMGALVAELRNQDARHLYAQGSNNFMWDPQLPPGDDFLTTARAKNSPESQSRNVRGSHATVDRADGHLQIGPPSTNTTYAAATANMPHPVVGHEVGQWSVYPNFKEIAKYTGVMRAHNFETFQQKLNAAGMGDQADDFFRASGALAALCYREEMEAALRTPTMGGFQLLDLQDFPGQGTALVGMLDAFLDNKGFLTPAEWRQSCAPIVLLAKFDRYAWTTGETFRAQIDVAHYGEKDLVGSAVTWSLRDEKGKIVAGGKISATAAQGGIRSLGAVVIPLTKVTVPARLNLDLQIDGTTVKNRYPLWVYPAKVPMETPAGVTVLRTFDTAAEQALARGERVVLIADRERPLLHTVGGGFTTDFWNWSMFHNKPGTMGLLMDPKHPALRRFPTDPHTNWQWFNLVLDSQPLVLGPETLPPSARPVVQVVDNMERNARLGLVFEAKIGDGRLLVCGADLIAHDDKPEARQLRASLLRYAGSGEFAPAASMTLPRARELLRTTLRLQGKATATSKAEGWQQQGPEQATDTNDYTGWRAGSGAGPHTWQYDFSAPQTLSGAEIVWELDRPGYAYTVEGTTDGTAWNLLSDGKAAALPTSRHRLAFTGSKLTSVRITITAWPGREAPSIREVRFFG